MRTAITEDAIAREYARRQEEHGQPDWGWSFLYTSSRQLSAAKAILIGLNPGGDHTGGAGVWDYSEGNAYLDEDWELGHGAGKAPLQLQVQSLLAATGLPSDEIACANFVPFRSPSWAKLEDREAAVAWSIETLWRPLLADSHARLFLSLGRRAGEEIARMLGVLTPPVEHPVAWGAQRIREYQDPLGRVVLTIPHLSRFQLFTGERSAGVTGIVAQAAARAGLNRNG